ncbi:hypothetical protein N7508_004192 [Penicillium antarcticum]|uniref:uncharacterized protein n=1 Tax=Penicillium antarcticum TaxID=416450 RepID=UPI002395FEEB|nr:uncharacterized protein N7508_004192 [Penicillium antarcticum]KAJ5308813.1 hypothetical protein N7508_004192 [Penicillium antarcticum]
MGEEMPDAKRDVAVYEALRDNVLRKYNRRFQEALSLEGSKPLHSGRHDPSMLGSSISSSSLSNEQLHQHHDSAFLGIPGSYTSVHDAITQYPNAEINPSTSDATTFTWDLCNDDTLWNMEAGLNEYAYGDPPATLYSDDPFDLHMFQ